MLDERDLLEALHRHWEYSGKDEDVAHEIYHDDAVLEFPQSGERLEAWGASANGGGSTPRGSSSTLEESLTAPTWSLSRT